MKKHLARGFLAFVVLMVVGCWAWQRSLRSSVADVDAMCATPVGFSVEGLIPKARRLGFSERRQGALGEGISLQTLSRKSLRLKDDAISDHTEGLITFGKVIIPPFLRHYCELEFAERRVVSVRKIVLD